MGSCERLIPKTIHMVWLQGWNKDTPEIVKFNAEMWRKLHPSYIFKLYDMTDVKDELGSEFDFLENIGPQAVSDIFRLYLMQKEGGIYVDGTVFPCVPLDTWLHKYTSRDGLFMFNNQSGMASYFIASKPNSKLISIWYAECRRYWSKARILHSDPRDSDFIIPENPIATVSGTGLDSEVYHYFWVFYMFMYLLESDPAFKQEWMSKPYLSFDGQHKVQARANSHLFWKRWEAETKVLTGAYIQKLDWRVQYKTEALKFYSSIRQLICKSKNVNS